MLWGQPATILKMYHKRFLETIVSGILSDVITTTLEVNTNPTRMRHVDSFFDWLDFQRARHHLKGEGIERRARDMATLRLLRSRRIIDTYPQRAVLALRKDTSSINR